MALFLKKLLVPFVDSFQIRIIELKYCKVLTTKYLHRVCNFSRNLLWKIGMTAFVIFFYLNYTGNPLPTCSGIFCAEYSN